MSAAQLPHRNAVRPSSNPAESDEYWAKLAQGLARAIVCGDDGGTEASHRLARCVLRGGGKRFPGDEDYTEDKAVRSAWTGEKA